MTAQTLTLELVLNLVARGDAPTVFALCDVTGQNERAVRPILGRLLALREIRRDYQAEMALKSGDNAYTC